MKNRLIGLTLCLLALIAFIGFHTMLNVKSRNKDTAYYILASNMFDKNGELIELDTDGKLIHKRKLKMQDVTKFNFNQDRFIAGGERANNNIILHGDGDYKLFSLLDNPNYSGVTSINLCDEKIVAKKSLEKLGSFSFQQDVSAIFTMNNRLYCIADNEICEVKDGALSDGEYTLPEGTFVSSYMSDNVGVHIYCRNENIVKENQKNHMGYIIQYDKQGAGMVKETPVLIGKRYDHILFFPREYIGH